MCAARVRHHDNDSCGRRHSGLMLPARATLAHFSISSTISFPQSAGEPAPATPIPILSARFTSGCRSSAPTRFYFRSPFWDSPACHGAWRTTRMPSVTLELRFLAGRLCLHRRHACLLREYDLRLCPQSGGRRQSLGSRRDHARMDFAVTAAVPSVRYPAADRRPESRRLRS